jgi:hypothetical protein
MKAQEFHDQVVQTLSRLETQSTDIHDKVVDINGHLGRLNGTVASVIASVADVRLDLTKHPAECKFGSQIGEIERQLATGDHPGSRRVEAKLQEWNEAQAKCEAAKTTSAKWWAELKPIIYIVGGAILCMALTHLSDLLKFYGVKP